MRLSQPRSNTLATRGTITVPLLSAGDWRYSSTGSVGSAKVRRSLSPPIGAPQRRAPLARSGSIIWKTSTLLPPDAGTPRHLWRKPQENEVQEKDGTAARRDDTLCKMEWASEQFQHESVQEQDATTFSVVSIRPTSTSRMRSHERDPAPAAKTRTCLLRRQHQAKVAHSRQRDQPVPTTVRKRLPRPGASRQSPKTSFRPAVLPASALGTRLCRHQGLSIMSK